jgi:hypothetical protein
MNRRVLAVAWYRFRVTLVRRWGGYLTLVLLIGLVGGLGMGALAGARRTQSSFPTYLASTNPPDLTGITSFVNPMPGAGGLGYDPALQKAIAHLPHVGHAEVEAGLNIIPLGRSGVPESPAAFPASAGDAIGITDTVGSLDNPSALQGQLFDPRRADQFMVSTTTARVFHFHVGEVVSFGIYTNAETNLPMFGTAEVKPYRRFEATLVGIVVEPSAVVQDDTDAAGSNSELMVFTPALTRNLLGCCT